MKIQLDENGMWGGLIPDILRNDRISININGVVLRFSKEEFEQLRSFLDKITQDLYNKAEEIVKENDKKSQVVSRFMKAYKVIEAKDSQDTYELENLIYEFSNAYWNLDLDAFKKWLKDENF